jgi:FkbM family methyltransferase
VINWSSIQQRSVLGRLLRAPLAVIPKSAVVRILAGPNRRLRWCVGAADHGCWLGSYELEKQLAIWQACRPGAMVFDVGANVGFYAHLMARAVGRTGQVVAIEPLRRNAARLRWHLRLNNVPNVRVVVGAACAHGGTATFAPGPTHTTGRVVSSGAGNTIRGYRLDDIAFGGHRRPPAVVKLDIEGGEAAALAGATGLLAARQTTWFVALHSREQSDTCLAAFEHHGYRMLSMDGFEIPPTNDGAFFPEITAVPTAAVKQG